MRKNKNKKYIFGKRNVIEFLKSDSDRKIEKIFLKESLETSTQNEITKLAKNSKIIILNSKELQQILPKENHQGMIIVCKENKNLQYGNWKDFRSFFIKNPQGPFLVLDRIQDMGNLGNILRTAECFGISAVILSNHDSAKISSQVEKISSGAIHYLALFQIKNLLQAIEFLKEKNYWIVASSEKGENLTLDKLPQKQQTVLIIGNEEKGIKPLLLKKSDFLVKIPMKGKINSLNATVATGILLDRIVNGLT